MQWRLELLNSLADNMKLKVKADFNGAVLDLTPVGNRGPSIRIEVPLQDVIFLRLFGGRMAELFSILSPQIPVELLHALMVDGRYSELTLWDAEYRVTVTGNYIEILYTYYEDYEYKPEYWYYDSYEDKSVYRVTRSDEGYVVSLVTEYRHIDHIVTGVNLVAANADILACLYTLCRDEFVKAVERCTGIRRDLLLSKPRLEIHVEPEGLSYFFDCIRDELY